LARNLIELRASELTHQITLRIRGLAGFAVRLWVARQLFWLGCRVAGVNLVIEQHDSPDTL
jgi:hypothetical protein